MYRVHISSFLYVDLGLWNSVKTFSIATRVLTGVKTYNIIIR